MAFFKRSQTEEDKVKRKGFFWKGKEKEDVEQEEIQEQTQIEETERKVEENILGKATDNEKVENLSECIAQEDAAISPSSEGFEEAFREEPEAVPNQELEEGKEKKGFFKRLVSGLTKTRNSIASSMDAIFSGFSHIDEDFYEELEEVLVMADLGVGTTYAIIEDLKKKVKEQKIKEPSACKELLITSIKEQMLVEEQAYEFENKKSVVLLIGVNGVGKTTSIGKLSSQLKNKGKRVIVAAADTFRAAAIEQLEEWTHRAGVEIIAQQEGSDPAAVVFDAVTAAKARNADILLCDTAGRLHNKKNLMEELRKINRVIDREYPDAFRETFVVLDGTTGQNALSQAKQFNEVADITGIILTKLDGTAKGGIAIAIQAELGIPVKYIGIGEKIEDLQKFNADDFVNALFDKNEQEA